MIIPQVPIIEPSNSNVVTEVQAATQFQRAGRGDPIEEILLRRLIEREVGQNNEHSVATGVSIREVATGRSLSGHNEETEHFAASVNKIPVALLVLADLRAGQLSLDQIMTWQESDRRGGFGVYDQPGSPLQASLRDVLYDMLNRSGNTVVRVLVNNALGGAAAVNERWAAMPELSHTFLIPLDANRFFLGNSTTSDSLWAMEQFVKNQDTYGKFVKDALATNIFTDFGVRSSLAGSDYIVLANKIGLLDDVEGNNRHDVGIIYNTKTKKSYSYSFFTTSPFDHPTATTQADQSLKDMGHYLLHFAGDRHTQSAPSTLRSLQAPDQGRMVY